MKSVFNNLFNIASYYFTGSNANEDTEHFLNQDNVDNYSDVQGQHSHAADFASSSRQQPIYNHDYDYHQPSTSTRVFTGRAALNSNYSGDIELGNTASTSLVTPSSRFNNEIQYDTNIAASSQIRQSLVTSTKTTTTTTIEQDADDGSSSEDATASSTSGCSSLVPSHQDQHTRLGMGKDKLEMLRKELMRKTKDIGISAPKVSTSGPTSSNKSALWSGGEERSQRGTKRFSVEKFLSPSSIVKHKSPFYEGKTVFGGAATRRISRLTSSPYTYLPGQKLAPIIRVNVNDSAESHIKSDNLSTAAKKILESMEKIATPIQDAKRMPLYNDRQTRQMNLLAQQLSSRSHPYGRSRGPPKVSILPQDEVSISTQVKPISIDELVKKHELTVSKTQSQIVPEVSDSLREMSDLSSGGGKMRSHMGKLSGRPSKHDNIQNTVAEEINLPNVPLILPTGILPKFNFSATSKSSSKNDSPTISTTVITKVRNEDPHFKFSFPILTNSVETLGVEKQPKKSFEFSKPLSPETSENARMNLSSVISSNSPNFSSTSTIMPVTSCSPSLSQSSNKSENSSGLIIGGSVMDVLGKSSNSNKESSSSLSTAPLSNWGDRFKPAPGSWSCPSCMLVNTSDKMKCAACESAKPGAPLVDNTAQNKVTNSWGDKFKPPSGSWTCSVCMIPNTEDKIKCVACETPNPKKANQQNESLKSSNCDSENKSPSSGTWQCDICSAQNKDGDSKCSDCETVKSGKLFSVDGNKDMYSGFKFGNATTTNIATSFKFGIPISEEPKNDVPSITNFGGNNKTVPLSGIKFGFPTSEKIASIVFSASTSEVPSSNSTTLTSPIFSFGVPKDDSNKSSISIPMTSKPVFSTEKISFSSEESANHSSVPKVTSNFTGGSTIDKSADDRISIVAKKSLPIPTSKPEVDSASKSIPSIVSPFESVTKPSVFGASEAPSSITSSSTSFLTTLQSSKSEVPKTTTATNASLFTFGSPKEKSDLNSSAPSSNTSFGSGTGFGTSKPFTFGNSSQIAQTSSKPSSTLDSGFKFSETTPVANDKIFGNATAKSVFGAANPVVTTTAASTGFATNQPMFAFNKGATNEKNLLSSTNMFGNSTGTSITNPLISSSQNAFGSFSTNNPSSVAVSNSTSNAQPQSSVFNSFPQNTSFPIATTSQTLFSTAPVLTTSSSFNFTNSSNNAPSPQFSFPSFDQGKTSTAETNKPVFQFGASSTTTGLSFGASAPSTPASAFGQNQSLFGASQNQSAPLQPTFPFNQVPPVNADPFKPQAPQPQQPFNFAISQQPSFNFGNATNNGTGLFQFR